MLRHGFIRVLRDSGGCRLLNGTLTLCRRGSSSARRRFYQAVSVSGSDGHYEVALDHRKLRTPTGTVLRVPNHALALAVAHEWASVDEHIPTGLMHITGLCNTVLDNPSGRSPAALISQMGEYLHGDTILFSVNSPPALAELQRRRWTPVVEWFARRFDAPLVGCSGDSLEPAPVPQAVLDALTSHLQGHCLWTLTGLVFAAEVVRSPLLALAAWEHLITPDQVAALSRLETEYQAEMWGRVPWSHDVDAYDTEARVSAGLLVARLCSETEHGVRSKQTG